MGSLRGGTAPHGLKKCCVRCLWDSGIIKENTEKRAKKEVEQRYQRSRPLRKLLQLVP